MFISFSLTPLAFIFLLFIAIQFLLPFVNAIIKVSASDTLQDPASDPPTLPVGMVQLQLQSWFDITIQNI